MAARSGEAKPIKIVICPFCGFKDDRETALSYPSEFNYCYHTKPIDSIAAAHQHKFCLNPNFHQCPIFQYENIDKMPKEFRGQSPIVKKLRPLFWLILVSILIIGGFFLSGLLGIISIPFLGNGEEATQVSVTTPMAVTPSITPINATATATPKMEPSLTDTPQLPIDITPHTLETVFGNDPQLMIHRIQEGEGFILLASNYQTSVEAIKFINHAIPDTLLVNKIIVLPIDSVDVQDLPAFSTYEVTTNGSTIEEIAARLKIDVEAFRKYNNRPEGYTPSKGEWLLIPH